MPSAWNWQKNLKTKQGARKMSEANQINKCPSGHKKTYLLDETQYQEMVKAGQITGAWAKKDNHTLLMCNTCEDAYLFRLRISESE